MNWQNMLFQDWEGVVRTILVGILAYIALVAVLRVSGKRTLAKLNAFDLVVRVALGSTLSAILLQESIALVEGAAALALLIAMQFLVTFLSVSAGRVSPRSFAPSPPCSSATVSSAMPLCAQSGSPAMKRLGLSGRTVAGASRTSSSSSWRVTAR